MKHFINRLLIASMLSLGMLVPAFAFAQAAPTAATSCARFTRNVTVGSRGSDITELQILLENLGFLDTNPTGYFGPLTRSAVAQWQASVGISPASGYVGAITRAYLGAHTCGDILPTHNQTNNQVINNNNTVPGCPVGAKYNYMTGQLCSTIASTTPNTNILSVSPTVLASGRTATFNVHSNTVFNGYKMSLVCDSNISGDGQVKGGFLCNETYINNLSPNNTTLSVPVEFTNSGSDNGNVTFTISLYRDTNNADLITQQSVSLKVLETNASTNKFTRAQGDLTGDGLVDFNDLVRYAQNANTKSTLGDVNTDGGTDVFDLAIIVSNYNHTPGQVAATVSADEVLSKVNTAVSRNHPGDATGDGMIDFNDLVKVAQSFNTSAGSYGYNSAADFNGDSKVDVFDLAILSVNYNKKVIEVKGVSLPDTQTTPTFTVISPNGGETWNVGSSQTLRWSSSNYPATSQVLLTFIKGSNTVLSYYTLNDGSEQISTPDTIGTGNDFKFQVGIKTDEGHYYSDTSDNTFTIEVPPVVTTLKGDVNGDGRVDNTDLSLYGSGDSRADLNKDGKVDFNDLVIISQNFNTGVYPVSKVVFGGDATLDGVVDFNDLVKLAQAFNTSYGDAGYNFKADFNQDGRVDYIDQSIMAKNYNTTGPKPEAKVVGDATGDGIVDFNDLVKFSQSNNYHVGQSAYNVNADFNFDGVVNNDDYAMLQSNYNKTTGTVQGASTQCVALTQPLAKGSIDAYANGEVTLLQSFLETQGYGFPEKGTFGSVTEASVKSWQGKQGIETTGITGPLTRARIEEVSCH